MLRSAWGKILGAFFGFSVAGPIGALFGLIVGNFFDKGFSGFAQTISPRSIPGRVKNVFYHATFAVMGHIAKSDGRISEKEIEAARSVMKTMRLNASEQREAINSFSEGKQPSFQLGLTLTEVRYACRQQPALLKMFAEVQYNAVMSANRRVDVHKQKLLNTVFEQLGFLPMFQTYSYQQYSQNSRSQYQHYQPQESRVDEVAEAYKTLNISTEANAAEIKKAYRKQMSLHHPDKLIAKGLSEKQVKEATGKAQKIQAAYERLKQLRGF